MQLVCSRSARRALLGALLALVSLFLAACGGDGAAATPVPPAITVQPVQASVVAGTSATFSVVATGDALVFQWQRSTDGAATWTAIAGATSSAYVIDLVDASMSGNEFRVTVTGASSAVTSSAVVLTVTASAVPPAITAQPADQSVTAGADASFSVSASGTALAYQWQSSVDSTTWHDVGGGTSATLTLSAVSLADSGTHYRAVVSSGSASVDSNAALLTVAAVAALPVIATQPLPASVVAPQPATFTVVANGTPTPTYQWARSVDGSTWSDIAGATSASYTTGATATADSGESFRVRVTNPAGSVLSNSASLTVAASGVAPAFTTDAADDSLLAPAPAVFSAHASGTPTPTYQWQSSSDGGLTFTNINGATSASYTGAATTLADDATWYRVVATNSVGSATSRSARLTVYNPGVGGLVASVARDAQGNLYATLQPDTVGYIDTFRTGHFLGVRKIDINGVVTTLAGNDTQALVNGTGTAASFVEPFGIAVDSHGNVFVSDTAVSTIRKITPGGVVTTFAGGNVNGGYVNGNGTQASFHTPVGLAVDADDNLYVADAGNNVIRKITPAGDVTTLAGGGAGSATPTDGTGAAASFSGPMGVSVDGAGNVYVADTNYHAIRKITPGGVVTTLAGGLYIGAVDATGSLASFKYPRGVAVDSNGIVWVADTNNDAIRRVTQAGVVTTFDTGGLGNSLIVDSVGNLYLDANYYFARSPYEIRKLSPADVSTAIPACCTPAP